MFEFDWNFDVYKRALMMTVSFSECMYFIIQEIQCVPGVPQHTVYLLSVF